MWLLFGCTAIAAAILNLARTAKGKDAKWFRFISLPFTAFTLCAFYTQAAGWAAHGDYSALADVVPSTSGPLWACTVLSVLINGSSLFGKNGE